VSEIPSVTLSEERSLGRPQHMGEGELARGAALGTTGALRSREVQVDGGGAPATPRSSGSEGLPPTLEANLGKVEGLGVSRAGASSQGPSRGISGLGYIGVGLGGCTSRTATL
jgi:hypothetical protein